MEKGRGCPGATNSSQRVSGVFERLGVRLKTARGVKGVPIAVSCVGSYIRWGFEVAEMAFFETRASWGVFYPPPCATRL